MKFQKIFKRTKIVFISSILAGGIFSISLPTIIQSYTTATNINSVEKVNSGKIIYDKTTPTVKTIDQIIIKEIREYTTKRMAIITNNGVDEIYVWGRNDYGQLGIGNFNNAQSPVKFDLTQFGDFQSIDLRFSNESETSYAIVTANGIQKLYMWGLNNYGQLCNGNTTNLAIPTLVDSSKLGNFELIDSIYTWEGTVFVITIKSNAKYLYGAGQNSNGQLGDGTQTNSSNFKLIPSTKLGNFININKFSISYGCVSVVVDTDNGLKLYVWGFNSQGQLGLGNTSIVSTPTEHTNSIFSSINLKNLSFTISMSSYAYLSGSATMQVWGLNNYGQLGLGNTSTISSPTALSNSKFGNGFFKRIGIGNSHSSWAEVLINGALKYYTWGRNDVGQLGLGNTNSQYNPVGLDLTRFNSPNSIKKLVLPTGSSSTNRSSYAITEDANGTYFFVWGENNAGQLSNKSTSSSSVPLNISIPGLNKILNAWLLDGTTTMLIDNNGTIQTFACGANNYGQLANNTLTNVNSMIEILPADGHTQFSTKNRKFNLSSSDAFAEIYDKNNNSINSKITRYIAIYNAPTNMTLTLIDSKSDFTNGILELTISPNVVIPILSMSTINWNQPINLKITGFNQVTAIENNPVIAYSDVPTNLDANQLYDALTSINGMVDNYSLLAQYVDLKSIPFDAEIKLTRIENSDLEKLDFNFQSNKIYNSQGISTTTYNSQGQIVPYITNVNIQLNLFPLGLVIGLSIGGAILLFLLIIIIIKLFTMFFAKKTYYEYFD